jgi:DNA-binding response OmpR family regulator
LNRLLFVEDDPLVSATVVPVLENLSFEVVPLKRGDEALRLLESNQFSVIVSDLQLPGASGLDVLRRARSLDPQVRLVAISGYADEEVRLIVLELGGRLLHKPFGVKQLRQVVLG